MPDHSPPRRSVPTRWLWALLGISLGLRIILAFQGGQEYFGDEPRYFRGPILYDALLEGKWDWVEAVLKQPEHAGFTYIALLVASFHHALAAILGFGNWSRVESMHDTEALAAAILGLFSTLNLWLIYQLALKAGANQREAGFATLFAAAANSLFYYSRHLLPYDSSLALALTGMIFSLSGSTRLRQFLSGSCAALAYQIYNGYWFLVPVIGFGLLFYQSTRSARLRAGCIWTLGLFGATALVALPGLIISGQDYWFTAMKFSSTVTQGVFAEGWSVPWVYLWKTEGPLGAVLATGVIAVVARDLFHGTLSQRVRLWTTSVAIIYTLLVLTSVGLEKFVVYARMSRSIVPFICLAAGYAADRLLAPRLQLRVIVVLGVALAAGANIAPNFALFYPRETKAKIWQTFGIPKQTVSFSGGYYPDPVKQVTRPDLVLVNAMFVYPLQNYVGYPAGRVLFSVPHPQNFAPYQYDGFTPKERRLLAEHPPAIRLIKLDDPASVPNNPPAVLFFHSSPSPKPAKPAARDD